LYHSNSTFLEFSSSLLLEYDRKAFSASGVALSRLFQSMIGERLISYDASGWGIRPNRHIG